MVQLFSKSCSLFFPLVCKLLINIFFCLLELIHAAGLGVASQILVTIAASDHAHGVLILALSRSLSAEQNQKMDTALLYSM